MFVNPLPSYRLKFKKKINLVGKHHIFQTKVAFENVKRYFQYKIKTIFVKTYF